MTQRSGSGRVYEIHDNGGTPFKVEDLGGSVAITMQIVNDDWSESGSYIPLYRKRYRAIFPGKKVANWPADIKRLYPWKSSDVGNTVLLHLGGSRYMYIGETIYEFNTGGDRILDYYSPIGNSDVPYPFAVGEHKTYLMLERVAYPRTLLDPMATDPYMQHYGHGLSREAHRAHLAEKIPMETVLLQGRLY